MRKKNAQNEYIDLNVCYFPEEEISDEFTGDDSLQEKSKTPANMYLIADEFTLYLSGDTAIKVTEHFKNHGKDITTLLEDAIRYDKQKM